MKAPSCGASSWRREVGISIVLACVASGCGDPQGADRPGGPASISDAAHGGTGGQGGTNAGGAGSTGHAVEAGTAAGGGQDGSIAIPDNLSMRAACVLYVNAVCGRVNECLSAAGVGPGGCLYRIEDCPDLFFSDGAQWTIEGLARCAVAWKTSACVDALDFEFPTCAPPGVRLPGEACLYGSQCTSTQCLATLGCGTCSGLWQPGVGCDETVRCPRGFECTDGVMCIDTDPAPEPPPPRPPPRPDGDICINPTDCAEGSRCYVDEDERFGGTCGAVRGLDEPCGEWDRAYLRACQSGLFCELQGEVGSTDFRCKPLAGNGEACSRDLTLGYMCTDGYVCTIPNEDGRCSLPLAAGERCGQDEACSDGLVCKPDQELRYPACVRMLDEGDDCSVEHVVCPEGTECREGMCVALDEITRFADACR